LRWQSSCGGPQAPRIIKDLLTKDNWVNVKRLIAILRPFIKATKRIEGNTNTAGVKGLYSAL